MDQSVVINELNKRIDEINTIITSDSIIVLKGIPFSFIGLHEKISYKDIIKDKIGFLYNLWNSKRRYILYEEFLLISDFIIQQYKQIFILNNNLYISLYPINDFFPTEIKNGLLTHFTDTEENDDIYIGDISEYLAIFNGLKESNQKLIGSYYEPELSNEKIKIVNIFENKSLEILSTSEKFLLT